MVTDTLFDLTATAKPSAPRCRMCARPARWLATQQQYAMYCAGKSCSNRERICQACDSPFVMSVDGAGTKYCSTECKAAGYNVARYRGQPPSCAWCGRPDQKHRKHRAGVWPYICEECLAPISHVTQRLRSHHVPHERARRLLTDSACEVCGRDLLAKVIDPGTGAVRAPLVVDHDHRCCPVTSFSCGQCIRGLLCANCNSAAGMLNDDPTAARTMADYLARFSP